MAELVSWAEQPDFLNARSEYIVTIVQDDPGSVTVIYRKEGREKRVRVANYVNPTDADKAKIPPPMVKLIEWVEKFPFN